MQPNVRYFKIWILFHQKNNFKCQSFTSSGCKNIGIRKLDLVGKTQFRLVKAKTLEYDQKTDKTMPFFLTGSYSQELSLGILNMEEIINSTRNWRLHADCLEKLSCLANCIRKIFIQQNKNRIKSRDKVDVIIKSYDEKCRLELCKSYN